MVIDTVDLVELEQSHTYDEILEAARLYLQLPQGVPDAAIFSAGYAKYYGETDISSAFITRAERCRLRKEKLPISLFRWSILRLYDV